MREARNNVSMPQRARFSRRDNIASDSSSSDEDAVVADGQGVWDHAFCVVCDCLIETDNTDFRANEPALDGEDVWEAAAMSSLRRHTQRSKIGRQSNRPNAALPKTAPIFCSERCRQFDQQQSKGLNEFMNYVSNASVRACAASLDKVHVSRPLGTSPFTPTAADSTAMTAKSLSASILRAESRAKSEAHGSMDDDDVKSSDRLFPRREPWPSSSPSDQVASVATVPSNLTRSRMAIHAALPAPSTSLPAPQRVPSNDRSLYVDSPPKSLVLGESSSQAEKTLADSPSSSLRDGVAFSPLNLLATGTGHHAEPSISATNSRVQPMGPASSTQRLDSATESLRRAQRMNDSALASARVPSSSSSITTAKPVRRSIAHASNKSMTDVSVASRHSDGGSSSDASAPFLPATAHRRKPSSARGIRVLPPLLAPPRARGDGRSRGPSPGALQRSSPHSSKSTSIMTRSRSSFLSLSSSMHGSSPRRPGLGWSALPPSHPSMERLSQSLRMERPSPLAMSSSASGSSMHHPLRTWSHDVMSGMPMYPILQLPDGGPIHDMYSQYWQPVEEDKPPSTPTTATNSETGGRRKSLFYFDG